MMVQSKDIHDLSFFRVVGVVVVVVVVIVVVVVG